MDCYTDDELIYLMRCGYQEAHDCLYQSYYLKIRKWLSPMCWSSYYGIDIDDYMQMMMLHFEKVLDSYREDRKASLKTFVKLSIRKRVSNVLKTGMDPKFCRDNILVSLDEYVSSEEGMRYDEIVEDPKQSFRPEVILMVKEIENHYQVMIEDKISVREKDVMEYKRVGYNEDEIANMLNISVRSVYNATYRYHKKMLSIDELK